MSAKILIADDDKVLADMLRSYLEQESFLVSLATDGDAALAMSKSQSPDLVVLDIMMPGRNGIEVLKELRRDNQVPVIMLTARGDDLDRILGLELGADDYLSKPCNPRELVARIRAVLRRLDNMSAAAETDIAVDDLCLKPASRQVLIAGSQAEREVSLTQTEFDLLQLLLSTPGKLVKKSWISEQVLGKPLSQWDRSIDVHISNLRRKLGTRADGRERIRTLRGSGYLYVSGETGN